MAHPLYAQGPPGHPGRGCYSAPHEGLAQLFHKRHSAFSHEIVRARSAALWGTLQAA